MLGAKAVFSGRIRAQIVCDRIFSVQFFGVKTNVLCALKKLYSLVHKDANLPVFWFLVSTITVQYLTRYSERFTTLRLKEALYASTVCPHLLALETGILNFFMILLRPLQLLITM